MRVASIRLSNFKRFSDLLVKDIPRTAKLVVVVGPNGSGKSSLFDAFLTWYRVRTGFGINDDRMYYQKDTATAFDYHQGVDLQLHNSEQPTKGCLYLRTAYRNDPDFSMSGLNKPEDPTEGIRISRSIDNDQAVSENYRRLLYNTVAGIYDPANDLKTVHELRNHLIGQIRTSMGAVFGDLVLNNLTDPLGSGSFRFDKGTAKSYHYKNLSGGEKAAFDLLLDIHVKKHFYSNAIYCIDELETHLHTRVQGTLIKEMVKILPDQCQLWVTTHSLGVLQAAQQMIASAPGSVAVIDFDGVDPDVPRELVPSNLDRITWEKLLSVALDELSKSVAPKHVIVCEGSSIGTRRKDFDAEIYNRMLGSQHPDIVFVSGGSADQVQASGVTVTAALAKILPNSKIRALRDRDAMSPVEVGEAEKSGTLVLRRRNLESYVLDDEVIEALVQSVGKPALLADALKAKQEALTLSTGRGNAPDDYKSAAGDIYTRLKKLLELIRPGNNMDSFMRDTLAPLISANMASYKDLKAEIIDKL